MPSLSVVIPTHNTRGLTLRCLQSLGGGGAQPVDVVVVDDASDDGTAEAIQAAHPSATIVETASNLGFSAAVNIGVQRTTGDLIVVLNSDTEVREGGFGALCGAFADDPNLGIAGASLINPDGSPQWSAGPWPDQLWLFAQASGIGSLTSRLRGGPKRRPTSSESIKVDWVSGAAIAVRRQVWDDCGPFDEGYRFYCQDLDLCWAAAKAGRRVAVIGGFVVLHHRGASIGTAGGAADGVQPAMLWSDLYRFIDKTRGSDAARRARAALMAGARLRVAGRGIASLLVRDRAGWRQRTAAYRDGLDALRRC